MAFCVGLEKIFSVSSISTSRPGFPTASRLKNAVWSLTRAACCMLWVTMTMVYSCFNSAMRSSIAIVEIGSSDEHGSSMSNTSGCTAMARAMHNRCC